MPKCLFSTVAQLAQCVPFIAVTRLYNTILGPLSAYGNRRCHCSNVFVFAPHHRTGELQPHAAVVVIFLVVGGLTPQSNGSIRVYYLTEGMRIGDNYVDLAAFLSIQFFEELMIRIFHIILPSVAMHALARPVTFFQRSLLLGSNFYMLTTAEAHALPCFRIV